MQIIYITTSSKDQALEISRILVAEKLLACANIFDNVTSVYQWQNSLNEDREVIIIGKTTGERVPDVIKRVKELHSYDCPCVVSWQTSDANADFADWVETQVRV